jgi:hypothetical protein
MTDNPYRQHTPEGRVFEAARFDHGLTDEQVLEAAGYVPHDGTDLRDELITLYRSQPGPKSFEEGLKLHAADWAFNGMRSDLATAEAYGRHMVGMHRAGDLTVHTSHTHAYPRFLAQREAEAEQDEFDDPTDDPAVADYLDSLERDALDGPHFYDLEAGQ